MIKTVYSNALTVLLRKPVRLWGLSLLYVLLASVIPALCVIPIISVSVLFLLEIGMTMVFLNGYLGKDISATQLFSAFNANFLHNCGGMAWMALWIFIWGLIPIAGPFIAIYKTYAYRFTPYILMTRPEVSATEALKLSIKETEGRKGAMFGADILIVAAVVVVMLVLLLLGLLPVVGFIFRFALFLVVILCIAFLPLLFGLIKAAFYAETQGLTPAPVYSANSGYAADAGAEPRPDAAVCPKCGAVQFDGAIFCHACGEKLCGD